MANVTVTKNNYKVDSLYQWDLNQELVIRSLSLPVTPEVHFAHATDKAAIVRQATMDEAGVVRVQVPNSLLQRAGKLHAYICIYEGETFQSLYKIVVPVEGRPQPADYTPSEEVDIYSLAAIGVEVVTLDSGKAAKVEKVLKDGGLSYVFHIPAGPVGPEGPQGLRGPKGDTGDPGPQGADGRSFKVLGLYATLDDLYAAHPIGEAGDAYSVGTVEANEVYIWGVDAADWVNIGALQGPAGPKGEDFTYDDFTEEQLEALRGPQGLKGDKGDTGATGPQGPQGPAGADGKDGAPGSDGQDGVSIKNVVYKQTTAAGNVYVINLTDGSSYEFTAPVGPKGADGAGGSGEGGGSGADGVGIQSVQLKAEADTGNTYTIILTDGNTYDFVAPAGPKGADGASGEQGPQGEKGADGAAGKDGTSVTVTNVSESDADGGTNVVTFSDGKKLNIKNGSKGSDGAPGADGSPGAAGKDGTSVTVSNVSESTADGGTNVVTFSDGKKLNIKNGSKGSDGAPGADGSPGTNGKDGVSPTIAVSAITGGNRLTITDANGSRNVDVMNGKDGKDGADGNDGSPGETGPAGRGVSSMTYNSSTNKWTVAFTDGTSTQVDGPAIPDVSGYMPKSGGTFTGAVKAAAASTSGYYVRNIKFSETAETPTTEGDICFKLK